jgi:hypothetical protein
VFYIDIAKVDRGVPHVAMTKYACCTPMFKCFRCFRRMLQMFHRDVLKVDLGVHMLQWLYTYISSVSSVSDIYCKCFIWIF